MRRELEKKEREERRTKEGARTSSENGIIGNKKGSRQIYGAGIPRIYRVKTTHPSPQSRLNSNEKYAPALSLKTYLDDLQNKHQP